MKSLVLVVIATILFSVGNPVRAQYNGCPHGLSPAGSETAYITWRFRDPATGLVVPQQAPHPIPNKVYQMEIYQTGAPANTRYANIGVQGFVDGFKIYRTLTDANNNFDPISDADVNQGFGPDVGSSGGVATFAIRTLPATDPAWSGQLTLFKGYGFCYPSVVNPPYPNKYYKKTLIFRP